MTDSDVLNTLVGTVKEPLGMKEEREMLLRRQKALQRAIQQLEQLK